MIDKDNNTCLASQLDPQLWHACAGGMVHMPLVNSKVYYFPQGHAEHTHALVNFSTISPPPPLILCRVAAVNFMADTDTDEVYARMKLIPMMPNHPDYYDDTDDDLHPEPPNKLASFTKTLTQSDANNGGGFSVPRYCAETIFPRLDYSVEPPVQSVYAKDVHGEIWEFRHIYRGTPRRHLLTTGWSVFVNQKKLIAGDSIVFMRTENGDLCVGIQRAKRGLWGGPELPSGWNPSTGDGFSVFLKADENRLTRNGDVGNSNFGKTMKVRGRVRPESVLEAATLASNGQPFEVVYYPRASTPEFCVKASSVRASMKTKWSTGMRFKMAFETEDSSRIGWFMGTVCDAQVADPVRWPNSPWRYLQVTWDEPDLLQNVKCVSPWLVELVMDMPIVPMLPFLPPRKRLRVPPHQDFPLDGQLPVPQFSSNTLGSSSPLYCRSDNTPAGIQGARHSHFGISLSDFHFNKLQTGAFPAHFWRLDHVAQPSSGVMTGSPTNIDSVSCLLTIGNSNQSSKITDEVKSPQFVLFGQPILTEQQISGRFSAKTGASFVNGGRNSLSVENPHKKTVGSDGSEYGSQQHCIDESSSSQLFSCYKDHRMTEFDLETGHCKVFMESEDVGRTIDLTLLRSYEELYRKLANMFGIEVSEMLSHPLYQDATGAVKHTGDEPFSEFIKTAKRLTVLTDSGKENVGRKKMTALQDAEKVLTSSSKRGLLSMFA